jgi:hypothetical protein
MSNEESNKVSEVITQDATLEPKEIPRGPSGEVGKPTASLTIKQMWHEKHFRLEEPSDGKNPRRQVWVARGGAPSLKQFARELVASGDTTAQDWFANKAGVLNEKRSDKNSIAASAAAAATRAEKRKKATQKQTKSKAKEEAPATVVTKAPAGK